VPTSSAQSRSTSRYATTNPTSTTPSTLLSSSRFASDVSGSNFTSSGLNVSSTHHISSRFEPTVHEDVKEVDTEKASPLDNSSSRFAPDASGPNFTSSGLNVSSMHHISSRFEPTVREDVKEVDTEMASPFDNRVAPTACTEPVDVQEHESVTHENIVELGHMTTKGEDENGMSVRNDDEKSRTTREVDLELNSSKEEKNEGP